MAGPHGVRLLACTFPSSPAPADTANHFEPSSSLTELFAVPHAAGVEVKLLTTPAFEEFKHLIDEFKPTIVYLGAAADYDQDKQSGLMRSIAFKDGTGADSLWDEFFAGKQVDALYIDGKVDYEKVKAMQSRGDVPSVAAWPQADGPPATLTAQFSHTFLSVLLSYAASVNEAFAMASHVLQAHCTALVDGNHQPPPLPTLLSQLKAELPDSNSIPPLVMPGLDLTQSIASAVPGWSDLRLLAPRAELRLLLCGGSSLIDSHKLSFLGEALRALLIMETRNTTLVNTSSCARLPVNLAAGCAALRCEIRTSSGRPAVVVLGGQPDVLKEPKLVEHALRMTLVSDSQSLQFRLPPPGVGVAQPRSSAAIAGGTPVVDALVLSSVWVVQVLRSLCQDPKSFGLISMGVAALGASATAGLSAHDCQRLKMLVSGQGPSVHPAAPLPEATPQEQAATEMAGPAAELGEGSAPGAEQATAEEDMATEEAQAGKAPGPAKAGEADGRAEAEATADAMELEATA